MDATYRAAAEFAQTWGLVYFVLVFALVLAYALLWAWFLVSLYHSAPNAEAEQGARMTRLAARLLGLFLAAVAALMFALSAVR